MRHLETGELRRLLDEPEDFGAEQRAHAQTCAECSQQLGSMRADAAVAARYLSGSAPSAVKQRRIPMAWLGIAAAAAFVVALFTTPLGTYAQAFLTVFEPRQVTPVAIDSRLFTDPSNRFPQLDQIGTFRDELKPRSTTVASLQAAQAYVPFRLLNPSVLPPQVSSRTTIRVSQAGTESFTFDARKAQAYALRSGKTRIVVPPYLDGATLRASVGPMVIAFYGDVPVRNMHGQYARNERVGERPFVTFVQSIAPKVTSSRASLAQLKAFVANLPGVTPLMRSEINSLSEGTLPIPFRPDKQTAQNVVVQGAQGLAIGDNTGLGAGIVWTKNGMLYGAAGMVTERDLLAFVNGLH